MPLVIPPCPNWYESSILTCSPDNVLIYGARNDIIILEDSADAQEPIEVKIIPKAHFQKVIAVGINKSWSQTNKYIASTGLDKVVKIWNADTLKKRISHNSHVNHTKVVAVSFAGDERVVSVSEEGQVVVFNVGLNETTLLDGLFGFRVNVTCMSVCPHATWLAAFGLKNGLVVVADLRKNGKLLHKLRGHDKSVLSLSWCPASVNIFPRCPMNYVGTKKNKQTLNDLSISLRESNGSECNKTSLDVEETSDNTSETLTASEKSNETLAEFGTSDLVGLIDEKECSVSDDVIEATDYKSKNVDTACDNKEENQQHTSPVDIVDDKKTEQGRVKDEFNDVNKTSGDVECEKKEENLQHMSPVDSIDDKNIEQGINTVSALLSFEKTKVESTEQGHIKDECNEVEDTSENIECNENEQNFHHVSSVNSIDDTNIEQGGDTVSDELFFAKTKVESTEQGRVKDECNDINKTSDGVECDKKEENLQHKFLVDNIDDKNIKQVTNNVSDEPSFVKTVVELTEQGHVKDECIELNETSNYEKSEDEKAKVEESTKEENVKDECIDLTTCDTNSLDRDCHTKLEDQESELISENALREIPQNISVEEEPRKEFLLASSAKENKIYIWRAGTDGRLQTFLTFPSKSNNRKNKDYNADKLWITLHWATPTKLLSSSRTAELLQWTLPKPQRKSNTMSIIHNDHHAQLFSIAGPVVLVNETNWLDEPELNVWTVGQERLLLNTNLTSNRTIISSFSTFGGSVSSLQLSPLDPNRLGIGTSDGFIKLMDLSKPHIKNITMSSFYQKIQSKVTTMAWHPLKEVILAYGTFEGRVGYLDVTNMSKTPILFPHYFKIQIHKIQFGPLNGNKEEVALYALSEGKLMVFKLKDPKEDPTEVDKPDDTYIYTFSWKPDNSILLVSTKKNSLITYSSDLKIISTKYVEHRIHQICWHPDASNVNENRSKYSNCFASVTNTNNIWIFNVGQEAVEKDEMVYAKYEGNFELINWISWSPHSGDNHLAIASDIGFGVIWDVEKNVTIASYHTPNFDPLLTILWSPLDSNVMISGGRDQTLRFWKISDYPPKDSTELMKTRKRFLKEIQSHVTEPVVKDDVPENGVLKQKSSKKPFLPYFYSNTRNQSKIISDSRRLLSWKENPSDVVKENTHREPDILDIFGPKMNLINLLQENERALLEKGQYNQVTQVSLFRGDISSSIKEAIKEKRVTSVTLSLAPMVSPKLWQEACETYAGQLSQQAEADPIEIATYYLACHKVEEAIDALCQRLMFREAFVLAKCRLTETDETVPIIIEKWAKHSLITGNFEASAQCYIFLGKYEEAATVLFRRSDEESLKFAGELAQKSGNGELYKAVMTRYNAFHTVKSEEKEQYTSNENGTLENANNEDSQEMIQISNRTDVVIGKTSFGKIVNSSKGSGLDSREIEESPRCSVDCAEGDISESKENEESLKCAVVDSTEGDISDSQENKETSKCVVDLIEGDVSDSEGNDKISKCDEDNQENYTDIFELLDNNDALLEKNAFKKVTDSEGSTALVDETITKEGYSKISCNNDVLSDSKDLKNITREKYIKSVDTVQIVLQVGENLSSNGQESI